MHLNNYVKLCIFYNSPVLQFREPPAIDSGEAKPHFTMGKYQTNAVQYEIT